METAIAEFALLDNRKAWVNMEEIVLKQGVDDRLLRESECLLAGQVRYVVWREPSRLCREKRRPGTVNRAVLLNTDRIVYR